MDMAQWLQVHQAERTGISANIDFQLPAGYFRKIFEARMGASAGSVGGVETDTTKSSSGGGSKVDSAAPSKNGPVAGAQSMQVQLQLLDKHQLRWMAFTLLGEALKTNQFPCEWEVLVEWIKTASQKDSGSRDLTGIRWDLAGQIADVFDQYIMYRPLWLREWAGGFSDEVDGKTSVKGGNRGTAAVSGSESGKMLADHDGSEGGSVRSRVSAGVGSVFEGGVVSIVGLEGINAWQPSFWREIRSRWGEYPNRADLMLGLVDELSGGDVADFVLPPQIVIFGIQSIAPILMEALLLKSKYIDVHWFQRDNECTGPFPDDFLSDLSIDQRDQSNLMLQLISKHKIVVHTEVLDGRTNPTISTPPDTSTSNPSKKVEKSTSNLNAPGRTTSNTLGTTDSSKSIPVTPNSATSSPPGNADPTTSISATFPKIIATTDAISTHRCHSPRREVEVLHDSLLHLFETKNIRPGDVAIVTPDVDLYAPFVREVFQSGSEEQIRIPIRISGGQLNDREIVADVLLKALDITNSRFKATEILDWLGLNPVLGDFLDKSGLRGTLNRWIEEQRVRWGSDKNHIKDIGFELEGRHSWMYGLQRILLARIASEDQDVVFDGQLSGSAITSKNENILLGRLLSIISALDEFRITSKSAHSMSDWSQLFQDLLDTVIVNDNWSTKCDKIRSVLHGMKQLNEDLLSEDVSLEIARDYLKLRLESGGLGRAWHPGFVTFTGMVALHQFPYKVVAMIGLNDGSLPGRTPVTAFDLLSKNHQPGDRIRRQADRQMFLDYLVTTEEILHISYTGLKQTDNKQLAPSVMVTALIDNLKRWSRKFEISALPQIEHSLQPFHSSYFDGSRVTKSYSKYYAEIAKKLQVTNTVRGSIVPELKPGKLPSLKEILGIKADSDLVVGVSATNGSSDQTVGAGGSRDGSNLESDASGTIADPGANETSESSESLVNTHQYSLLNLISFYNNPIKYTLRNGYGISLFESEVPDEDVEPFELNALDKWKIRAKFHQNLLVGLKKGGVSHTLDSKIRESISVSLGMEGILPDAIAGQKTMNSVMDELSQIWDEVRKDQFLDFSSPLVQKTISRDVNLIDGMYVNVSGEIDLCVNNTYFGLEAGSVKQKIILQHWIHHVLLNGESPVKSRVYFRKQKQIDFIELSVEESSIRLYNLLFIMVLSEQFLMPIFPGCSELYLENVKNVKNVENGDSFAAKNAIRRIIDSTSGESQKFPPESVSEITSPWTAHAWSDRHPLSSSVSFKNLTPDQLHESTDFIIKMSDFEEYDAFSVISVKLFGLMKGDLT
jgi:exodeoxyribonuclease V gamma subunit